MVVRDTNYMLIIGQLQNMGLNHILHQYVLNNEEEDVISEFNSRVMGGYVGGKILG